MDFRINFNLHNLKKILIFILNFQLRESDSICKAVCLTGTNFFFVSNEPRGF